MFTDQTFQFLEDLAANNDREWFQQNRDRYEHDWLQPSLAFIESMQKPLRKAAPFLVAKPTKVGGSLMRIHRDSRFSRDKTPYKTNIGIQFRHDAGKDIHAPGFYLHVAADECFVGAGIWHPDSPTLQRIRTSIDENQRLWGKVRNDAALLAGFQWWGETLKTPPRGFAKDHAWIEDLKRKDFLVLQPLTRKQVMDDQLTDWVVQQLKIVKPMMKFLYSAVQLPY